MGKIIAYSAPNNDLSTYFIDEGSHQFSTELPNLIDDLGLSVYTHRLYVHVKRRAGAEESGKCTAGLRSMAKCCGMSLGLASRARRELLDLGLIRCREEIVRYKWGGGRYEVLTIADVWPANFIFYEGQKHGRLNPFTSDYMRVEAARAHLICDLVEKGCRVVKHRPSPQAMKKGEPLRFWDLENARAHLATFLSDGGVSPRERGCTSVRTSGVSAREQKKEPKEERTLQEDTPTAHKRATPERRADEAGVCV